MKIVSVPTRPRALLFDLDSTLYTHPAYAAYQDDVLVECLARAMGKDMGSTQALLAGMRSEREAAGLGKTSLANLSAALGFDIATSVSWREENIRPGEWLEIDLRLDAALGQLGDEFALALVTNNPRKVGEKSLEALGVRSRFAKVIGLDSTMESKPSSEPYLCAARLLDLEPRYCVSVGDRYDIDLAPALSLGMGAILIEAVEDIYGLPEFFDSNR